MANTARVHRNKDFRPVSKQEATQEKPSAKETALPNQETADTSQATRTARLESQAKKSLFESQVQERANTLGVGDMVNRINENGSVVLWEVVERAPDATSEEVTIREHALLNQENPRTINIDDRKLAEESLFADELVDVDAYWDDAIPELYDDSWENVKPEAMAEAGKVYVDLLKKGERATDEEKIAILRQKIDEAVLRQESAEKQAADVQTAKKLEAKLESSPDAKDAPNYTIEIEDDEDEEAIDDDTKGQKQHNSLSVKPTIVPGKHEYHTQAEIDDMGFEIEELETPPVIHEMDVSPAEKRYQENRKAKLARKKIHEQIVEKDKYYQTRPWYEKEDAAAEKYRAEHNIDVGGHDTAMSTGTAFENRPDGEDAFFKNDDEIVQYREIFDSPTRNFLDISEAITSDRGGFMRQFEELRKAGYLKHTNGSDITLKDLMEAKNPVPFSWAFNRKRYNETTTGYVDVIKKAIKKAASK